MATEIKYYDEIKRKAQAGEQLTNPTAEKNKLYEQFRQQMNKTTQGSPQMVSTATQTNATSTQPSQPNYQSQIQDLVRQMQERMSAPQQEFDYNLNRDPSYQAALERARDNSRQGGNMVMAEMNRRNILNSTMTGDRSNEIAQREMGRVETQVAPQLMQAAYQRYMDNLAQQQQQFSNLASMANMLSAEEQRALDNANRDWMNKFNYGQAIGTFGNGQQTLAAQNQAFNQNMANQQFDRGVLESDRAFERNVLESDRAYEQNAREFAQRMGLDWAQLDQRQQEFIADQAWRQYQIDQDSLANQSPSSVEDLYRIFDSSPNAQLGEDGKPLYPTQLEAEILSYDIPESEMRKLYQRYGLKWGG